MSVLTGRNFARLVALTAACVSAAALAAAPVSASPARPSGDLTAEKSGIGLSTQQKNRLLRGAVRTTKGHAPKEGIYSPAFAKAPISTRVIGGEEVTNAADYPWIVGIETTFAFDENNNNSIDDNEWFTLYCTGTVLSSKKVLTAAHCSVGYPLASTVVIAGRVKLDDNASGGAVVGVASTWTHQSFKYLSSGAPVDDVSVLTLKTDLPAAYTPVALSAAGDQSPYAEGTSALIIGYGRDTRGSGGQLGVLHKATVPVKSDATCTTSHGTSYQASKMFCAGIPDVTTGVDTCGGDSGGPVIVAGKQVGITDWGKEVCGSDYGVYERISYYRGVIDADLPRRAAPNLDFSGDGHSDLMTRTSQGYLVEHDGSGLGSDGANGFTSPWYDGGATIISTNSAWKSYTKIFRVKNWLGDNNPGIMGKDSSGRLFFHKSDGMGGLYARVQIGSGWNSFTDIMVTNNWTGNGRPNLMGRTSTGVLMLYTSNMAGGWMNPKGDKIGSGWNMFNTVLTPGEWLGDGRQTLIGRTPAGALRLYISKGAAGGWVNPSGKQIGTGWNSLPLFMSPGDWNGDNLVDLMGRTSTGDLRLYTTNGKGQWLDGRGKVIGKGWNYYNAIF